MKGGMRGTLESKGCISYESQEVFSCAVLNPRMNEFLQINGRENSNMNQEH